jgi:deazaflavin-dependent oxidoreductase (nitroreductase family)
MAVRDAYKRIVNRLSATRAGSFVARHAAPIDPWIYRKTGGRFTASGIPTIPQLVLTTTGRKSGLPRSATVACLADGEDFIVVGSNFGQGHHPAWALNLLANPEASVQVGAERFMVKAERLDRGRTEALWPRLDEVVPQFRVYRRRTDRDIHLFRLRRTARSARETPGG